MPDEPPTPPTPPVLTAYVSAGGVEIRFDGTSIDVWEAAVNAWEKVVMMTQAIKASERPEIRANAAGFVIEQADEWRNNRLPAGDAKSKVPPRLSLHDRGLRYCSSAECGICRPVQPKGSERPMF